MFTSNALVLFGPQFTPLAAQQAMLLSNLTVSDDGCKDLLQLGQERLEGLNMAILLKKFVVSGVDWVEGRPDPFEHLAGVVVNVTRLQQGRKLLLQPGRGLLQALVSQLLSPSETRRRGAAGAIKNCCMQAEVRLVQGWDRMDAKTFEDSFLKVLGRRKMGTWKTF